MASSLIDRWTRHHFGDRVVPRERIRAWVASTDLALELALSGNLAAVVPADVAAPYRRSRELTVIRATGEPLQDPSFLSMITELRERIARVLALVVFVVTFGRVQVNPSGKPTASAPGRAEAPVAAKWARTVEPGPLNRS